MPFYLQDPIPGKTKYYSIRGTHGAVYFANAKSTKATEREAALRIKRTWERLAEQGKLPDGRDIADAHKPVNVKDTVTFADAAQKYIIHKSLAEGSKPWKFINNIVEHRSPKHGLVGKLLCKNFNDDLVMDIAQERHAGAPASTRNRGVYTPIKAVLKRSGFGDLCANILRPDGWNSYSHDSFINFGDELDAVLTAADRIDNELGLYCELLAYTPTRKGMVDTLHVHEVDLDAGTARFPGLGAESRTKNGEGQTVPLTPRLVARLRAHLAGKASNELVFSQTGKTTRNFWRALAAVPGLIERLPKRHRGFHLLRHSYGTEMNARGVSLVGTGGWKTQKAADLYKHKVSPDALKVLELPTRPLLVAV